MSTSNSKFSFQTINPFSNEILNSFQYEDLNRVSQKLLNLQKTWKIWRKSSISDRKNFFKKLAEILKREKENLALSMALEMGKPIYEGRAEVEKSALTLEYYSEILETLLQEEILQIPGFNCQIQKKPLGIILAIMPWNYPLWQRIRFAVPGIAMGNVVLMKHSDLTAGTAVLIEKIFKEASLSVIGEDLLLNACMSHETVVQLMQSDLIQAVTFTGSVSGGKKVAALAGENLKKVVLELGGSDPYLVFEDADLDHAAKICVQARMINNGQSCIAGKRFLIHKNIFNDFMKLFEASMAQYKIGNPVLDETKIGPLSSSQFKTALENQIQELKKNHSYKETRFFQSLDSSLQKSGAFFAPTILTLDSKRSRSWDQEFFGPVACCWSFDTDDEVLEMANHTVFGLGSSIFTKDMQRAARISADLDVGMVFINEMVRSDAHLPFGGVKSSGFGRELGSYGPNEFVNIKTVVTRV